MRTVHGSPYTFSVKPKWRTVVFWFFAARSSAEAYLRTSPLRGHSTVGVPKRCEGFVAISLRAREDIAHNRFQLLFIYLVDHFPLSVHTELRATCVSYVLYVQFTIFLSIDCCSSFTCSLTFTVTKLQSLLLTVCCILLLQFTKILLYNFHFKSFTMKIVQTMRSHNVGHS